jgi:hypothetical protein
LDIEDKGTSGQTFLAAVDFLQQQQPTMAIFENVDGAPWEKMQEYITGYCKLPHRNDTKAILLAGGGSTNADTKLKFSIQDDAYVAEDVPRQVGIQAGAAVQGFIRGTDTTQPVVTIHPDHNKTKKPKNQKTGYFITLAELAKLHGIDLERDTLVMRQTVRYCTHLCKLDTKDYGLPQTRNRKVCYQRTHSTCPISFFSVVLLTRSHKPCSSHFRHSRFSFFYLSFSSIFFCGKPTIPAKTMIWAGTFRKYSTTLRPICCTRWTLFCYPTRTIAYGAFGKRCGPDRDCSSSANGPRSWTFGIGT